MGIGTRANSVRDGITGYMRGPAAVNARPVDEAAPLLEGNGSEEEEFESDWAGVVWHKRPHLLWLLPPFCIYTIAFGGSAVPKLNVILTLICRRYFAESELTPSSPLPIIGDDSDQRCQIAEVHARTSTFILLMGLISGIISAFTAPRLGSLSDRHGRKKFLVFASFGMFANEVFTVMVMRWPERFPIELLMLGCLLDGLCGSFMLGMALSYSYAADCTGARHRATAFGALQGCLFLGVAVGPVLGGLLASGTGRIIDVFYATLGCHVFFMVYCAFILPESLPERRQEIARKKAVRGNWWEAFDPRGLLRPLRIFYPTGPGSSRKLRVNMMSLAIIDCTLFGVGMSAMPVIIMYAEKEFGWENLESSIYLSVVNSVRVTVLFLILPTVISFIRRGVTTDRMRVGSDMLDINIIRIAVITEAFGYFMYAAAPNGLLFTIAGGFVSLGGMGSPTIQSTLTKHIPQRKTGEMLGAMALLHSLSRVIGPIIFNSVYSLTVGTTPYAVFICLGSTFSVAFVCSWMIKSHVSWKVEDEDAADGENRGEAED